MTLIIGTIDTMITMTMVIMVHMVDMVTMVIITMTMDIMMDMDPEVGGVVMTTIIWTIGMSHLITLDQGIMWRIFGRSKINTNYQPE